MPRNTITNDTIEEGQQTLSRSDYLRKVRDFAHYMNMEYIQEGDGDRSLMICAADASVGDEELASACITIGGRRPMLHSLVNMMRQDEFKDLFGDVRKYVDQMDDAIQTLGVTRRRLRVGYVIAAFCVLWTCFIIFLQVCGIANWITTISNLLLMVFVFFQLYGLLRDLRRKVLLIEDEERRMRRDRLEEAMGAFTSMLQQMAGHMRDDDDED